MLTFNVKIILFIVGLIIGFFTSFLFRGCDNTAGGETVTVIQPKQLKKQAENTDAKYTEKIAALEKNVSQLESELKTAKSQIAQAKQKTTQRENTIKKIIGPKGYPAKELLKKMNPAPADSNITNITPCDSLVSEVGEYMQENKVKDSLYQSQISMQDSIIAVKDSVTRTQDSRHAELQTFFNQSLSQQEFLIGENKQLRKKIRRQKFKNTLKTIGLMFLSGAAANYIINH